MTKNAAPDTLVSVPLDNGEEVVVLFSDMPAAISDIVKAYEKHGGDVMLLLGSLANQTLDIPEKLKLMRRLAKQVNR